MNYKEMMDYKDLIKALTCQGAEDEPDNLGCGSRECKYRDADGGCNLVSLDLDAAIAILSLLKRVQKAERERDAAVRDINLVIRQEYYLPCVACENSQDGEPCEGIHLEGFTCRANAGWRGVQEE